LFSVGAIVKSAGGMAIDDGQDDAVRVPVIFSISWLAINDTQQARHGPS
jgi:hypothetical protein